MKEATTYLNDDEIKVVLIDRDDNYLGIGDKIDVHKRGQLHRAFSVILYNQAGQMLLQRRALSKYHSPGLWANSCCGHPFIEEIPKKAAERRLREELGFTCAVDFRTRIKYFLNVDHGMIEHEYVHVFDAIILDGAHFNLNEKEVMEIRWAYPIDILAEVKNSPNLYTKWFRLYVLKYFARIFR